MRPPQRGCCCVLYRVLSCICCNNINPQPHNIYTYYITKARKVTHLMSVKLRKIKPCIVSIRTCVECLVWVVICWHRVLSGKTPRSIWVDLALCQHGIRNEPNCKQKAIFNRLDSIKWTITTHQGLHLIFITLFYLENNVYIIFLASCCQWQWQTSFIEINNTFNSFLNMLSPARLCCGKMTNGNMFQFTYSYSNGQLFLLLSRSVTLSCFSLPLPLHDLFLSPLYPLSVFFSPPIPIASLFFYKTL